MPFCQLRIPALVRLNSETMERINTKNRQYQDAFEGLQYIGSVHGLSEDSLVEEDIRLMADQMFNIDIEMARCLFTECKSKDILFMIYLRRILRHVCDDSRYRLATWILENYERDLYIPTSIEKEVSQLSPTRTMAMDKFISALLEYMLEYN